MAHAFNLIDFFWEHFFSGKYRDSIYIAIIVSTEIHVSFFFYAMSQLFLFLLAFLQSTGDLATNQGPCKNVEIRETPG